MVSVILPGTYLIELVLEYLPSKNLIGYLAYCSKDSTAYSSLSSLSPTFSPNS